MEGRENMNILESKLFKEFEEYLQKRYSEEYRTFTADQKIEKFEIIFMLGLKQAQKYRSIHQMEYLLYNDKPPRSDMIQKLGHILFELQKISTFPIVPPLRVSNAIKKTLSSRDKRTQAKYLKWIIELSNSNRHFNTIDLSNIVKQFPEEKIVQGGIW